MAEAVLDAQVAAGRAEEQNMADSRDQLIEQIRAELRAGTFKQNLDWIAVAALSHLTQESQPGEFTAVVLLADRAERALALLALAERGIPAACLASNVTLDELASRTPALLVVDPASARRGLALVERALPETVLVVVGSAAEPPHLGVSRPLTLPALQAAVEAIAPARLARRGITRALVVGRDEALLRALQEAGCEVTSTADAVELFVIPPRGTFDVAFPGPEIAADANARATLAKLYGPGLVICPA